MCFNTKPVHVEQHAGFKIEIWYDDDCQNPATDFDIPGEYTVFQSRDFVEHSNIKHPYTKEAFIEAAQNGELSGFLVFIFDLNRQSYGGIYRSVQVAPERLVTFTEDDRFDGIYIVSPTEILKEWGSTPTVLPEGTFTPFDMAVRYAKSFLKEMNDYYSGNCHGFKVIDSEGEEVSACWGFIGDYDGYILEEAKRVCEGEAKRRAEANEFAEKFMCC